MKTTDRRLRVGLIAGSLGLGGAEKQLVYQAGTLMSMGVDVRVYSLTRNEYYEDVLVSMGLATIWIGQFNNPLLRLLSLVRLLHDHQPHFLHATHFFTNLYSALAAKFYGALSIGSLRGDTLRSLRENQLWGRWLLSMPSALIGNSQQAKKQALSLGINDNKVYVLPNVIDCKDFDRRASSGDSHTNSDEIAVITVARLVPAKRLDRFLRAISLARRESRSIVGIIVGDGEERPRLEDMAKGYDLIPNGVKFLGQRDDIPWILTQTDIFILTSDDEGFPNVLLEAMSARLPVITTPAGESHEVVQNNVTGFVIPYDDVERMAQSILHLANSAELRQQFGNAGRLRVEQHFDLDGLSDKLLEIYGQIAKNEGMHGLMDLVHERYARV